MSDYKKNLIVNNGIAKADFLNKECHAYVTNWQIETPSIHTPHRHDFFSIDFIYDGEFVQTLNGKEYICPKGTVCLLSPFDFHFYENRDKSKMISLTFSDDILFKFVGESLDVDSTPYISYLDESSSDRMMEELMIIDNELNSGMPLSSSYVRATLNRIVIDIIRNSVHPTSSSKKKKDIVQRAISYIRYHYREPITLEDISKMYYVTPEHFCRYFKNQTGLTFKEYIISLRLDYAIRLIKYSNMTITEICFESGFSSPSYFTKAFFKRFGKTPIQVRES